MKLEIKENTIWFARVKWKKKDLKKKKGPKSKKTTPNQRFPGQKWTIALKICHFFSIVPKVKGGHTCYGWGVMLREYTGYTYLLKSRPKKWLVFSFECIK